MLQGVNVRMHRGSVCHIHSFHDGLDGERCTVLAFDAEKGEWLVRVQGGSFGGKELNVAEASLRLSYCLLPSAPTRLRRYFEIQSEDAQGGCGRGLVTKVAVAAGEAIFDEPPLVVVYKSTSPQEHHSERWLAYATLLANASNPRAKNSVALTAALAAFNDLCVSEQVPDHVRLGAAHITAKQLEAAGQNSVPPEQLATFVQQCTEVLMRFQANQFTFQNHAPSGDPYFYASAVYAFTSRVNHCCAPSMGMVSKELYCKHNKLAFSVEDGGGVLLAYSKRDLKVGERLTFNYGPDELVEWGLKERRAFLLERLNFVCGCERCVAEEAAEAAALKSAEEIEEIQDEIEGDVAGQDVESVAGAALAEEAVERNLRTAVPATAEVAAAEKEKVVADAGGVGDAGEPACGGALGDGNRAMLAAAGAAAAALLAMAMLTAMAARRSR